MYAGSSSRHFLTSSLKGLVMTQPHGQVSIFIAASLMMAIAITAAIVLGKPVERTLADQARIERNRTVAAQCSANVRACIGGFVLMEKPKQIIRIEGCGRGCRNWEMDVNDVRLNAHLYEAIVLPSYEAWSSVAVAYSRQFVDPAYRNP
jgi:hypothetical protein